MEKKAKASVVVIEGDKIKTWETDVIIIEEKTENKSGENG